MKRTNIEIRVEAYKMLNEIKDKNIPKKDIINKISEKFKIPKNTITSWYNKTYSPLGKKIKYNKELFYVLGALLGDGCIYHWKKLDRRTIILVGDKDFTAKYAKKIFECTGAHAKNYIDRNKNIWFVTIGNNALYYLFKEIRENPNKVLMLMQKDNFKENSLQFIEGFFDAEGCVKIIKEKARKTPKICLDITNTNKEILEIVRNLLEDNLSIKSNYSIQRAFLGKDGSQRQEIYHLRIYKKEFIKRFFDSMNTTKLKPEKINYVENWLNNGK